ncbi:flagellar basal body L-ring protein FlgH [uncultured Sphingomonas sp.]|uniref:flagellar basal body L-ring protein FlgH n=1 Tax=uncultured Sphingomonas sp. TaxID=158754 RepID=UPI0025F6ABDA|nr:flagellar basal body L-ring protein FlgH [uncultured Sphingomonas sp.]
MTRSILLLGAAVTLAVSPAQAGLFGGGKAKAQQQRAEYAPTMVPMAVAPPVADGAIFHAANGYAPLTSGQRAATVGDVLTIILAEKTQAVKSNSASTDRNGSIGLTPPSAGPLALFSPAEASVSGGGRFDGKGAAAQSNALSGEISVTVAQVYPNGTMLVRGEKLLTLNRGDEQIRISGIVRAADIDLYNRVPSTRVADARISYSGTGEIARASRQGWLNRFFSILSPF